METTFCDNCDNLFYIYSDENSSLYYGCRVCGNQKEFNQLDNEICVYENIMNIDTSKIFNSNMYLTSDKTLPRIKNNKNLRCPNVDCSKTGDIIFINYDEKNMLYMYICETCGQKWKNKI
jgi:DNA-directed RNA polymerase subunit M/transcription elongation factor TFIIS